MRDGRRILRVNDWWALRRDRRIHVPAPKLLCVDVKAEEGIKPEPDLVIGAPPRLVGAQSEH